MGENEFDMNIEIGITGECYDKLKFQELKKELKQKVEEFFEKEENVANYVLWQIDFNIDYEKLED